MSAHAYDPNGSHIYHATLFELTTSPALIAAAVRILLDEPETRCTRLRRKHAWRTGEVKSNDRTGRKYAQAVVCKRCNEVRVMRTPRNG